MGAAAPGEPAGAQEQPAGQLRMLADRAVLSDLISRYFLALDEGTFDDTRARAVFTPDAALSFPPGDHRGLDGLVGFTADFMAHWVRTHHHCSNLAIDVNGGRAALRWDVIATHVHHGSPPPPAQGHHFQLGGRFDAAAVRTGSGWRIEKLALRVLWTTGTGIPSIAATMAGSRRHQ